MARLVMLSIEYLGTSGDSKFGRSLCTIRLLHSMSSSAIVLLSHSARLHHRSIALSGRDDIGAIGYRNSRNVSRSGCFVDEGWGESSCRCFDDFTVVRGFTFGGLIVDFGGW